MTRSRVRPETRFVWQLTFHIPLPIKDDERITLALSLFILDDPDPLDRAVHFEFPSEIFLGDFFRLAVTRQDAKDERFARRQD